MVTEACKEDSHQFFNVRAFMLKKMLEDVRKGMDEIFKQYRHACDENKEKEDDRAMKELKDFIIEVYKIKRKTDQKCKGITSY